VAKWQLDPERRASGDIQQVVFNLVFVSGVMLGMIGYDTVVRP
jgi:hypothetical protein